MIEPAERPQGGRPPAAEPDAGSRADNGVLKLADGIDLIGEYKGSGFKEPPYIARRADGQVIQLPKLLFLIAKQADGHRDVNQIAAEVTREFGRGVSGENVGFLADKKLRPLGVLAAVDGSSPRLEKPDPMLALKFRAALIPKGIVNGFTAGFHPLFWPVVVLAVLAGLVALDAWLFFFHGVAQSVRNLINEPVFFLLVFVLVVVSAAFHECGHATGLRYGGGKPGVMGAGLYMVWPAFYTDVTDAYRLSKGARLRTDLGGVYFNVVFMLLTVGAYILTHFEPLLVVILFQQFEMLHQFLPFLRLDGYYVISDLTGVPDIFLRIKPTLLSLIPGRKADQKVTELKPWVRVAVTLWVVATALFILYAYGMMMLHLPTILGTAWQSLWSQIGKTGSAFGHGNALTGVFGALQITLLVLPLAGLALTLVGLGKRMLAAGWTRTKGRPLARGGFTLVTAAVALLLALAWWPHSNNYRSIQPTDTGTLQSSVQDVTLPAVIDQVVAKPSPSAAASAAPSTAASAGAQASPSADASASASASANPSASPSSSP
jgi:putative peptide zinc metalloprotease protein